MDWLERFLNKEIYINCETEAEAKLLLDILSNYGKKLRRPFALGTRWHIYGKNTIYGLDRGGDLAYGTCQYHCTKPVRKFGEVMEECYE